MSFEQPKDKTEQLRERVNELRSEIDKRMKEEEDFRKNEPGASQGIVTNPETLALMDELSAAERELKELTG